MGLEGGPQGVFPVEEEGLVNRDQRENERKLGQHLSPRSPRLTYLLVSLFL